MADEWLVERVLTAVEQVPPGRVVAYGDIARAVGCGPRQVGAIMRSHGAFVTWWRVTNSHGDLPPGLLERALPHWDEEGIDRKPNRRGCRMAVHRVDLEQWHLDVAAALDDRASPGDEPTRGSGPLGPAVPR